MEVTKTSCIPSRVRSLCKFGVTVTYSRTQVWLTKNNLINVHITYLLLHRLNIGGLELKCLFLCLQWKNEILDFCPSTRILLIGCKTDLRTDVCTLMELSNQKQTPITYEQVKTMQMNYEMQPYIYIHLWLDVNLGRWKLDIKQDGR